MEATIKVQVAGNVKEYPADIAGFGDHLADGGKVIGLFEARRQGKAFFRANRDDALKAVAFWPYPLWTLLQCLLGIVPC